MIWVSWLLNEFWMFLFSYSIFSLLSNSGSNTVWEPYLLKLKILFLSEPLPSSSSVVLLFSWQSRQSPTSFSSFLELFLELTCYSRVSEGGFSWFGLFKGKLKPEVVYYWCYSGLLVWFYCFFLLPPLKKLNAVVISPPDFY